MESGSIKEVLDSLFFLRRQGFALDMDLIRETLNTIVTNSTPLGYHYEVSWALWGLISFNLGLNQDAISALPSTDNSIVAILALDAHQRGLAQNLNLGRWAARMTEQDLLEEEWLLRYEANVHNWLSTVGEGDHAMAHPGFRFLKQHDVRFYVP